MTEVHVLAIDLAKRSFQVCGTDRGGAVLFNRMVSRSKLEPDLARTSPLHCRDGGLRHEPLLGADAQGASATRSD